MTNNCFLSRLKYTSMQYYMYVHTYKKRDGELAAKVFLGLIVKLVISPKSRPQ